MAQNGKFMEIKDYLNNHIDGGKDKNVPAGAVRSVWMTLPPEPKNKFDEVFPNVFLGNYSMAKDKEKLKEENITHVVNCSMGTKFNQINTDQTYFEDVRIKFHGIKALDILTFKMTPHFEPAAAFIDEAIKSGGRVYVHCQQGVSRSASIVLAFLMLKRSLDVIEAVKTVREKREIFPNDGFLRQLCELDQTLADKAPS